jgi:spore germination cell wall hydrolase CwlJ-like protein
MEALLALLLLGSVPQQPQQPTVNQADKHCLASNIYYEARSESLHGKKAVAQVTLNRVNSKKYPKSVCAVVLQNKQFSWVHQVPKDQQQKALKGIAPSQKHLEVLAYQEAKEIAEKALKSNPKVLPDDTLWYHTTYVNPVWNRNMQKVNVIGTHVFYKEK